MMSKSTPSYCLYCGKKLGQRQIGFSIVDGKLIPGTVRKRVREHAMSCPKWPKDTARPGESPMETMPYYLREEN